MVDTPRPARPDTSPAAGPDASPVAGPMVQLVYRRLLRDGARFLRTGSDGQAGYSPHALAVLIAEILTEHTAAVRAERAGLWRLLKHSVRTNIALARQNTEAHVAWFDLRTDLTQLRAGLSKVLGHDPQEYPGDARVLADLAEVAGEARERENEVISLGCEVEKLERALIEAARQSDTAARFVDTMLTGGAR